MDISQAKPSDLIEILYLLKVCISDMQTRGLTHWNSAYPDTKQIEKDLLEGNIYLLKDKSICKGMITLSAEEPSEYRQIVFNSTSKPLYVKRMAVHPGWSNSRSEKMLLDFAMQYAGDHGFGCLRTDIWQTTIGTAKTCEDLRFVQAGTAGPESPKFPMICYEKQL